MLKFFFFSDKTVKLWKVSEREKQAVGYNLLRDDGGLQRGILQPNQLLVPHYEPMELMIEASPKKVFANAHMYHINSISINSDDETYLSADDLRINLWHLEITDRSFSELKIVLDLHQHATKYLLSPQIVALNDAVSKASNDAASGIAIQ